MPPVSMSMCMGNGQLLPSRWMQFPMMGMAKERVQLGGKALYLPGRVAGHTVWFLVDTRYSMSLLAEKVRTGWGRPRKELERYWGRLCSVGRNTLDMLTSPSSSEREQ